jgi:hypothetical protein
VGTSDGFVLTVEWDEVFDVGGDQRPAGCGGFGEELIVRHANEGGIGDDGAGIVAAGLQLHGDLVGEHFVEQEPSGHR